MGEPLLSPHQRSPAVAFPTPAPTRLLVIVPASHDEGETEARFQTIGSVLLSENVDLQVILVDLGEGVDEALGMQQVAPGDLILLFGVDVVPAKASWLNNLIIGLSRAQEVHSVGAVVPDYAGFLQHKPVGADLVAIKGAPFLFSEGNRGLVDRCMLTSGLVWRKLGGFQGSDPFLVRLARTGVKACVARDSVVALEGA